MIDRTQLIGASEVSTLLGLNPFSTPLQLWSLKTGRIQQGDETENMEWGKRLEKVVSQKFSEKHGVKLMAYKKRFVHPDMPYFSCELDNIITGTDEIVEIKTVSAYQWRKWENENSIPEYIIAQVTAQMGLSGRKKAWIACLCGGQKYIEREVEFDQELYDLICEKVKDFWENFVLTNTAPLAVGADNDMMVELYPDVNNDVLTEASEDISNSVSHLQEVKMHMAELKKTKEDIEAKLKQVIGDTVGIITPEYVVKWTKTKASTYTVERPAGKMLRITKNKGEK